MEIVETHVSEAKICVQWHRDLSIEVQVRAKAT